MSNGRIAMLADKEKYNLTWSIIGSIYSILLP